MPRNEYVYVTNRNPFFHEDRYDGQDFAFPPGEKVQIPVEAAVHMFGFGLIDQTDTLVRLGWATRFNPETKRMEENPEGVGKLTKFVFTRAVLTEEKVSAPADLESDDDLQVA
jgi:hypothetical protein